MGTILAATNILGTPEIILLVGALLVLAGIVLAFRGRRMWAGLMSLIGAIIGGSLGYLFGLMMNQWVTALILSMVGAFLGSLIFGYIVKIALAFVMALLVAGLNYIALGSSVSQDVRVAAASIILLVAYAIAYWFIQEIIALVTALIGGILIGIGSYLLGLTPNTAIAIGALVFFLGFIIQTVDYRRDKKRRAAVRRTQVYYAQQQAYAPPSQPVVQSPELAPPPPPPPD